MTPRHVTHARQFFTAEGYEIFYAEAYGRRPDCWDALRVMGFGNSRNEAEEDAKKRWGLAWRSLYTAVPVAAK